MEGGTSVWTTYKLCVTQMKKTVPIRANLITREHNFIC